MELRETQHKKLCCKDWSYTVYFCKKCHAPDDNKDALFQKIPAPAHLKDSKQVAFAFRPFCSYHGLHTVLLSISSKLYDEL